MSGQCLAFVGDDDGYYGKIKELLEEKLGIDFGEGQFVQLSSPKIKPGEIVLELAELNPSVIVIDFSWREKDTKRLAMMLAQTYPIRKIPVIGLLDGLGVFPELVEEIAFFGVKYLFYKLIETETVVQSFALALSYDQSLYADTLIQKVEFILDCYLPVRIGYLTDNYFHVETDAKLKAQHKPYYRFDLNHISDAPAEHQYQFEVSRVVEDNLYYHFKYAYDVRCHTMTWDLIRPAPKDEAKELEETSVAHESSANENNSEEDLDPIRFEPRETPLKTPLLDCLDFDRDDEEYAKRHRLLIIDRDLELLKQSKSDIEDFPYNCRIHENLDDSAQIVRRVKAGVICIVWHKDEDIVSVVGKVIGQISQIRGYNPFLLIIYAHEIEREPLLAYERILWKRAEFSLKGIQKVMSSYQTKGGRRLTHHPSSSFGDRERRVYFTKKRAHSRALLHSYLRVKVICEFFIIFETDLEFSEEASLLVQFGEIRAWVRITDPPTEYQSLMSGKDQHFGIIAGVAERQLQQLRMYVQRFSASDEE